MQFGYCTNVHSGTQLDKVLKNLETCSIDVQTQLEAEGVESLGLGLWLSSSVVKELEDEDKVSRFRDWLREKRLNPFTINGFPFGDFHKKVVKFDVYLPTWASKDRLEYTWRLAQLHHELLLEGELSTISTLPLGWPQNEAEDHQTTMESIANLLELAQRLSDFETETGREVVVCIEPEPGCLIDTASDLVSFFEQLFEAAGEQEDDVRRHIGVCHDICHSAVMHESQATAIEAYAKLGVRIGKIQVSSAVEVDFVAMTNGEQRSALAQLAKFAEPKFLHQTMIEVGGQQKMFHDLYLALSSELTEPENLAQSRWRVHYHVPIYLAKLGHLGTSQQEIIQCLAALKLFNIDVPHFEIETYAWNEIPEELRVAELADGIAKELKWWLRQQASWK